MFSHHPLSGNPYDCSRFTSKAAHISFTLFTSLVGNYEINVAIYSPQFAQQLSALFECDTTEVFELTMQQWQSRPWFLKVSERLLAPWRFMM